MKILAKDHLNMPRKILVEHVMAHTLNGWLHSTQVCLGLHLSVLVVISTLTLLTINFMIEDEYLIPMGHYDNMRDVVDDATRSGTQILTFKSTRAVPIYSFME